MSSLSIKSTKSIKQELSNINENIKILSNKIDNLLNLDKKNNMSKHEFIPRVICYDPNQTNIITNIIKYEFFEDFHPLKIIIYEGLSQTDNFQIPIYETLNENILKKSHHFKNVLILDYTDSYYNNSSRFIDYIVEKKLIFEIYKKNKNKNQFIVPLLKNPCNKNKTIYSLLLEEC